MMPPDTTNFSLFGKNMIVFIPAGGAVIGNGLEAKSRKARDAGAIGIIVMSEVPSTVPGFSDIVWNECCPSDVEIPVVEVGLYQSIPWISVLLTSGSNLTVYVNDSDPNMWRDFVAEGPYHIYFGSLWLLVSFSLLIYALSKTYGYYQNRGAQLNTGFVFLLIESFCNLERFFFFLIDPMFTHQVLPHVAISVMYTFTYPFSLITSLLITLTWLEILKSAKNLAGASARATFLKTSRYPFLVLSIILIVLEIVSSTMRGLMYNVGDLIIAIWTIYGIIGILIAIFFFVLGFQVLESVDDLASRNTAKDLMYSGIFLVCQAILLMIAASPLHFQTLAMWLCAHNLSMFFVHMISFTQLKAIPVEAKAQSQTSTQMSTTGAKSKSSSD
eukprot:TRINITY_DN1809_c1_g1_i3.p1 TRINITY_DN1809_c1_g1~~TRINITY_DN1809_c1_g1_i3.p1  ORF type:complete len:386 (-),score=28.22 TRINITY_DN1809_c1_g1_i3:80-1237(-)